MFETVRRPVAADAWPAAARAIVVVLGFGLSWAATARAETGDDSRVRRHSEPCSLEDVRLRGEMATRYQAATCNLLTRTDRYSLDTFAANAAGREGALWWDWPGDQFGRWFSVLNVADGLGWTQAAWHRAAVGDTILPIQTADGYFGQPGSLESDDNRIPSGNAFGLAGLVDAYRDTGDARYLEAARRLAGYFEAIAPRWETKGKDGVLHEFYGHCLDGLVALHEESGDRRPLELASRLGKHAGRASHTHHALSLCRGLIDLARATGDVEYLEKAEDYLSWCRESQLVTGGLPEMMPRSAQDEGCALADWIVVNLKMFEHTGDDAYLDAAEQMLVNHFFMNQFHTGGFGHLGFDPKIVGGKKWQGWDGRFGSENPGCCSLWGQWALGQTGRYVVTSDGQTVLVNLYVEADVELPSRGIRVTIESDFPRMRRAKITVRREGEGAGEVKGESEVKGDDEGEIAGELAGEVKGDSEVKPDDEGDRAGEFDLALRVPSWARRVRVECAGQRVEREPDKGRVVLRRDWRGEEVVLVEFIASPRFVSWPKDEPLGVAVFDGPLCLGLSSAEVDVERRWTIERDARGNPSLDEQGRPTAVDASEGRAAALRPIGDDWLVPDTRDPRRYRVLFD